MGDKSPSGFVVFLRVGECGECHGRVKIMEDRANKGALYQEAHIMHGTTDKKCPGSEQPVNA